MVFRSNDQLAAPDARARDEFTQGCFVGRCKADEDSVDRRVAAPAALGSGYRVFRDQFGDDSPDIGGVGLACQRTQRIHAWPAQSLVIGVLRQGEEHELFEATLAPVFPDSVVDIESGHGYSSILTSNAGASQGRSIP